MKSDKYSFLTLKVQLGDLEIYTALCEHQKNKIPKNNKKARLLGVILLTEYNADQSHFLFLRSDYLA